MKRPGYLTNCALFVYIIVGCCNVIFGQRITLTVYPSAAILKQEESNFEREVKSTCITTSGSCRVNVQSVIPSDPCGKCFAVYPCSATDPDFCLRYVAGQGVLDPFQTIHYVLTLRAIDDKLNQATATVDVHIQPNLPPYFPTMFRQPPTIVSLGTTDTYTVDAVDPEDDTLIYSMYTVPQTDVITIATTTGVISATTDLRTACMYGTTAVVSVRDTYHNEQSAPTYVNLVFKDADYKPIINNLGREIYVRENTDLGDTVLELAVFHGDKDPPSGLTYSISAVPSTASDLFTIDAAKNQLIVKSELNYESFPNPITLSIRASDGFCDSDLYTLPIQLVNINEAPFLFPVDQTVDSCEGNVSEIRPNWSNVSDQDTDDKVFFTKIESTLPTALLTIDPETGVVSTTFDYDLDQDQRTSSTIVATVTLSDRQGLTATATLTIRFFDCNDNAPTFNTAGQSYQVRDCWPVGTAVGNLPKAEDADSTLRQNNVIYYYGEGNGAEVQSSGSIITTKEFKAGESLTFEAFAMDRGKIPNPLTSKPFYVSLYTLPCYVPPTTADPLSVGSIRNRVRFWLRLKNEPNGADFLELNLRWAVTAGVLAAVMLLFFILMMSRICCPAMQRFWGHVKRGQSSKPPNFDISKQTRKQLARTAPPVRAPGKQQSARTAAPVRQSTPPLRRTRPVFISGHEKDTYPDKDYEREPAREALPEPNKGPELLDTNSYEIEHQTPPTPIPKQRKRRTEPGFISGQEKDTYPDKDYEREPAREALPEPNKGPELLDTNSYEIKHQTPPTPTPKQRKHRTGSGFISGQEKDTYHYNDYEREPVRETLPEPNKGPEILDTNTYDIKHQIPNTPTPKQMKHRTEPGFISGREKDTYPDSDYEREPREAPPEASKGPELLDTSSYDTEHQISNTPTPMQRK